jgi:methionyl-tRNA formyltransferase
MTIEAQVRDYRYALLLNGSNFACEVLQALRHLHRPPALLVLPEYAPARSPAAAARELVAARPQRRLLQLAHSLPIAYAPEALQSQCARLIRRRAIDFLLVACWPYLIGPELIDSAARAALNLHPSLLPRYRGPDPVACQLERGERRPGVSLHLLSQQFDEGDIVAQCGFPAPIGNPDRARVERQAARLGSRLFIDAINAYDAGWRMRKQARAVPPGDPS